MSTEQIPNAKDMVLIAISSLGNPTEKQIEKYIRENKHSQHQINVLKELTDLKCSGKIKKFKRRFEMICEHKLDEDANKHITEKTYNYTINYNEFMVTSKSIKTVRIREAIKHCEIHHSVESVTDFTVKQFLNEKQILEILQIITESDMRCHIRNINIGMVESCPIHFQTVNLTQFNNKQYPKLQSLLIGISEPATKVLMNRICEMATPNLQRLMITDCESYSDHRNWTNIVETLVRCSNFKHLCLQFAYFNHSSLNQLNFEALQYLELNDCDILRITPEFVLKFLNCKSLKILNMDTGIDREQSNRDAIQKAIEMLTDKFPNSKINVGSL